MNLRGTAASLLGLVSKSMTEEAKAKLELSKDEHMWHREIAFGFEHGVSGEGRNARTVVRLIAKQQRGQNFYGGPSTRLLHGQVWWLFDRTNRWRRLNPRETESLAVPGKEEEPILFERGTLIVMRMTNDEYNAWYDGILRSSPTSSPPIYQGVLPSDPSLLYKAVLDDLEAAADDNNLALPEHSRAAMKRVRALGMPW